MLTMHIKPLPLSGREIHAGAKERSNGVFLLVTVDGWLWSEEYFCGLSAQWSNGVGSFDERKCVCVSVEGNGGEQPS